MIAGIIEETGEVPEDPLFGLVQAGGCPESIWSWRGGEGTEWTPTSMSEERSPRRVRGKSARGPEMTGNDERR